MELWGHRVRHLVCFLRPLTCLPVSCLLCCLLELSRCFLVQLSAFLFRVRITTRIGVFTRRSDFGGSSNRTQRYLTFGRITLAQHGVFSHARGNMFSVSSRFSLGVFVLHREYISVRSLRGRVSNDAEAVCGREHALPFSSVS